MTQNWLLTIAAAAVICCSVTMKCSADDIPPLTGEEATPLIDAVLNKTIGNNVIYRGDVKVWISVKDNIFLNPNEKNIDFENYRQYQVWEKLGYIAISVVRDVDKTSGWGQFSMQRSGFKAQITVTAAAGIPKSKYITITPDSIIIKTTTAKTTKIFKIDQRLVGVNTYSIVRSTYQKEVTPEALEWCRSSPSSCQTSDGKTLITPVSGKLIILFKYDEFSNKWIPTAQDYADGDTQFNTDNVDRRLR